MDGDLAYTGLPRARVFRTGISVVALSPVQPGQMFAVRLFGKHVSLWGGMEQMRKRALQRSDMVVTMLVFDDKGTGLSNGFIAMAGSAYLSLLWVPALSFEPVFETQKGFRKR
jgi:hypothetical protein